MEIQLMTCLSNQNELNESKKFIVKYVSKNSIFRYIYILPFIKMHYQLVIGMADSRKLRTVHTKLI